MAGLYRMMFRYPSGMIDKVRGEAMYFLAARTRDGMRRLKPNLVTGLPVVYSEAVN
ncbi:hypothetical protein [Bradyrhizobium sp. 139]|uniref:hypothetical protein n=1 Tax=Bradyrhizobium sp. 139 TaxID=2782616 RepID=UPI001FF81591|nr:hypothetical protein [Bradyrhizobium sp. 139]